MDHRSVLLITLDSCRYDTFEAAYAPNMKAIGPLYRATAPASFTYASHAAMFVGFTPGVADAREPYVNPKYGRIFRMRGGGREGHHPSRFLLSGRNVVEGFRRLGYATIGSGALPWFDPVEPTSWALTQDFDEFHYAENTFSLGSQLAFLERALAARPHGPAFVFLNVGETHVPYFHEGASWPLERNPCVPYSDDNDAEECRRRQTGCLEFVDAKLGPLVDRFAEATVVVCADHGDAWGEDGVWEHGVTHPCVLEVPLVLRVAAADDVGAQARTARARVEAPPRTRPAKPLIRRRPVWPPVPQPPPPPECPAGWRTGPPDFVGIGVQKAGTTWWHSLLTAHPSVSGGVKELHYLTQFWQDDFGPDEITRYHEMFPRPPGMSVGEWTPRYVSDFWGQRLLAAAAPEARLLVILRDPVERYRSGLTHYLSRDWPEHPMLVVEQQQRGYYHTQLQRWLRHFPREQLLVLQFERCLLEPEAQLERTYRFLGLDPAFRPERLREPVLQTTVVKRRLPEAIRESLVELYRPDVARLAADFAEIDISLWPNFADGA